MPNSPKDAGGPQAQPTEKRECPEGAEIRPRVAQGEEANPYGVDDAERCTQIHLGRRCCYPKEHGGNCALEFAASASPSSPPSGQEAEGKPDERPSTARFVGPSNHDGEGPYAPAAGQEVPSALPEEVVCENWLHPRVPHQQQHWCNNPRPAHPPAARTEREICKEDGWPMATDADLKRALGPADKEWAYSLCWANVGCRHRDPKPVSAAPVDPARAQMLVICAANWDTPHVLNSHHLSESHYCINPKDAPPAQDQDFNTVTVSYSPESAPGKCSCHLEAGDSECFVHGADECGSCGAKWAIDPTWRWNGKGWEHKCPGLPAQAGHFPAKPKAPHAPGATPEPKKLGEVWALRAAVGGCADCCLCGVVEFQIGSQAICQHPESRRPDSRFRAVSDEDERAPDESPDWCPLRTSPLTVQLRAAPTTNVGED